MKKMLKAKNVRRTNRHATRDVRKITGATSLRAARKPQDRR